MNTFTYDGTPENSQKAMELYAQGVRLLCHKCNAEVLVLNNWDSASKYNKRPGIYCPVNEKHICVWFITSERREEFWRRFYEFQKERENLQKE
ncbi:MAG TPA: hypothetical protein DEG17_15420 [Cyanobacteria bacterium UBA11149]|nr:hypothetical protein [Cyanobacteria bacterium UBA11367]HBE57666.1 hypothetical protein [Cyanobacteria bacterium UBA11366]HBK65860.1 hypothetical protein [Cyanobacteria bacterium UBA11166]HBR72872.1 hypothetical protein [Cyanobacteria bacterium UBA11159]HBS67836.1 hypothetical protein [Cyanobacteria bacterium UBA11153]HBW90223.1 hypothetical protein [Cyanobacteria bacterium UBA11149]HCA93305.1 hypothetical protein [Cyanobacteria bacterium UBA9226]